MQLDSLRLPLGAPSSSRHPQSLAHNQNSAATLRHNIQPIHNVYPGNAMPMNGPRTLVAVPVGYPVYAVQQGHRGNQIHLRNVNTPSNSPIFAASPIPPAMHPATPPSPFFIPQQAVVPLTVTDYSHVSRTTLTSTPTRPPASPRSDFLPSPALTAASPDMRGASLSPAMQSAELPLQSHQFTHIPPTTTSSELAAANALALLRSLPQPDLSPSRRRPSILYQRPASPPALSNDERVEVSKVPPRWYVKSRTPSLGGGVVGIPGQGVWTDPYGFTNPAETCDCPVCRTVCRHRVRQSKEISSVSTYSTSSPPYVSDDEDLVGKVTWSSLSRVPPTPAKDRVKVKEQRKPQPEKIKARFSPYPPQILPPLPTDTKPRLTSQGSTGPVASRPRASSFGSTGSRRSPPPAAVASPARPVAVSPARARPSSQHSTTSTPDRDGEHKLRGSGMTHLSVPGAAVTAAAEPVQSTAEVVKEVVMVDHAAVGFKPATIEEMSTYVPEESVFQMGKKTMPVVVWKGTPLEIPPTAEGFANLSPAEVRTCAILRIWPAQYLHMKSIVVGSLLRHGLGIRKAECKKLFRIDVNKTGKVWDWFEGLGWTGTMAPSAHPQHGEGAMALDGSLVV
ncbi:hypothetical protein M427DRAFT_56756 [Gonapodya prolifera JEL478]|uniref:SWIRM domain-containing protein n=1 Tax=Gonapodya prolifera (strain JEL478) TaxID=1344416 RepID=A0A139AF70_GONPJ|nr:hypothetical protein M427DRAFT_56756 [Gonapodya prolifera JEL478]|eukprot:KXS15400.1 hypothetical protein M427DRAFT_56756 [Gonapodya prolifera JEL478]